jgi:hypothetical protein
MTTLWERTQRDFEPDGGLRDIYVAPATAGMWQRFLAQLAASSFSVRFAHGGLAIPALETFAEALSLRESDPVLLQITLAGGVSVNCHFFTADEIELDVDPREIRGPADLETLRDFVQWLADAVGQRAFVTYENAMEQVIFACDPATERS